MQRETRNRVRNAALGVIVVAVSFAGGARAADNVVTNKFKTTLASNTPLTAYAWSDSSIWQDETAGAPYGWCAKATMPSELPLECFYLFPSDGLKLSELAVKRGFYIGDVSTAEYSETLQGSLSMDAYTEAGSYLYGNYHPISRTSGVAAYLGQIQIAGRIVPGFESPASAPKFAVTGKIQIRHDYFAESADALRPGVVNDFAQYAHTMNGSLLLFGPCGADAQTSTWKQTAGSAFVWNTSTSSHGIVPGMAVTGEGVSAGTFVRYTFPRSRWIALSQPIEEGFTKSSNALTFGAITPSVSETYLTVNAGCDGKTRQISVARRREADAVSLTIGEYIDWSGDPSSGSSGCTWGYPTNAYFASQIPGDIIISKFTLNGKANRRSYVLGNVRLTFNCDVEEVTDANPDFHWSQTGGVDSRVTVAEGKTVHFSNFHDLIGTIDKRGAGKLVLPLKNADLTGTVKVAGGEFEFRKTSAISEATVLNLNRLELSSGAIVTVPAAGLTVDSFVCAAGAIVRGGPLTVNTDSFSTMPVLSVTDGGSFVTTRRALTRQAAVPSTDRWLHLDASDATTLVTEAEGDRQRVVRWNDVGGGAVNARPFAVSGFENGSILLTNACNGLKAVDLGSVSWGAFGTTDGSLSGDGKARVMFFYNGDSRFNASGSAAFPVNTAFFMVGSQGGGGTLLNASGDAYGGKGLPHTGNPAKDTMISAELSWGWEHFTKTAIDNGTILFRENGVTAYPHEKTFSGGWDVIAYRAGGNVNNRQTSGLGMTANGDGRASYAYDHTYGGLAYGEVILFTNHLTTAQIDYVEAYLMKKWKNVDTEGYGPLKVGTLTLDADSSVDVSGDGIVAANVTGAGAVHADLVLSENASLVANVDADRQIGTLEVSGTLTLPQTAVLSISGQKRPARGIYTLYAADAVVGDVSGWSLATCPGNRSAYRFFKDGNAIKLRVGVTGFCMFLR